MTDVSTAGHGPSRGYSGMNDALKKYFRANDDPKQRRMDAVFTRTARLEPVEALVVAKQPGYIRTRAPRLTPEQSRAIARVVQAYLRRAKARYTAIVGGVKCVK